MKSQNNRIKSGNLLSNNEQIKTSQTKTSTVRINKKKNMLMQKCHLKFNSFITSNNKKTKKSNYSRDYFFTIKNKQKHKNLKNHKKTFTTNYLDNNSNLLKKNHLNKNKNIYKSGNLKKKTNNNDIINFGKNNEKYLEKIFYDDENNHNFINRSNYIIKVKTKINPNENNIIV